MLTACDFAAHLRRRLATNGLAAGLVGSLGLGLSLASDRRLFLSSLVPSGLLLWRNVGLLRAGWDLEWLLRFRSRLETTAAESDEALAARLICWKASLDEFEEAAERKE